jgi:hypothetical protein
MNVQSVKESDWKRDPDGEYNEQSITLSGHKLTIFSDREETTWTATIDEDEPMDLVAKDQYAARREALNEFKMQVPD